MATARAFNGKLSDELLNGEIFYTLKEAKIVIEDWRRHDNTVAHIHRWVSTAAPEALDWPPSNLVAQIPAPN
jgi:putative transposase